MLRTSVAELAADFIAGSITIVEAVMRIHQAGVQHTDLDRLSNILISEDNLEARIIDFGFAIESHTVAFAECLSRSTPIPYLS